MTPSPFEMGNHSPTAPLHPQRKVENWALTEGRPAPLTLRLCCYQHKLMTCQWLPRASPLCIPWFVTSWVLNRMKGWVLGGSKAAEGLSSPAAQGLSVTWLINMALAHVSPGVEERAAVSRDVDWKQVWRTACRDTPSGGPWASVLAGLATRLD